MHQGTAALSPRPHWENPPPSTTRAAEYLYTHSDHLNTPKVVTDQDQQIVWKADYEPFGEVVETVSTIDMSLRYPGQYHDGETGLNYNYFRSYDASTGRYTQSDPAGVKGGLNLFQYASANPVRKADPSGLFDVVDASRAGGLDLGDGGVFCDGNGGFEVRLSPNWDECLRSCARKHENTHIAHVYLKGQQGVCSGKSRSYRLGYSSKEEQMWTEKNAYLAERQCLAKNQRCECQETVRKRIEDIDDIVSSRRF